MAQRKQAEVDFTQLCARYNIWRKKWQDVRNCPWCRKPIFITKRQDGFEEAPASIVDYLCIIEGRVHWVECKGKGDHNRLPLNEISFEQNMFMNTWSGNNVPCWLYVTLGDGRRAPVGRKAWLIEWDFWYRFQYSVEQAGMKSIPWIATGRKADIYNMTDGCDGYELRWVEGGWQIPVTHPIWPVIENLEPIL